MSLSDASLLQRLAPMRDLLWALYRCVLSMRRRAQVSDEQMKELAVKTETTNPWYWGVRTLVKVGLSSLLSCDSIYSVQM